MFWFKSQIGSGKRPIEGPPGVAKNSRGTHVGTKNSKHRLHMNQKSWPLTRLDGADDGIRAHGPSPCRPLYSDPDYASDLRPERTTGFEPATLTFAK